MATDTVLHEADTDKDLWSGAKKPFKAGYGKLMMWYFLLSDAFTFAGFLIAYGAIRFSMPTWPVPDFVFAADPFGIDDMWGKSPLIFVTFMTFVLIVSSVTMVRAVQEGKRENKNGVVKWMIWTIIGGSIFLGSQAWEWTTLIKAEGMTVTTNPFSNHLEPGRYMSDEELKGTAGFVPVKIESHGHGGHGDHADHGEEKARYYYLREGTADLPENRFFAKVDHHGHSQAGKEVVAGDPYLITYGHGSHMYEFGAINRGGVVGKEEFGPVAFGSLFFFITGFHGFHVLSGVIFLIIIAVNVASGVYVKRKNGYEMVEKIGLYWHFVDLVWVFVFLVFYLL